MTFNLDHLLDQVSRGFADIERQYGSKTATDKPNLRLLSFDEPEQLLVAINDAFRTALVDSDIPGMKFLSPAIVELGEETGEEVHALVRTYQAFDPSDPAHDHGIIAHPVAGDLLWQINYYTDESCEQPASNPEDIEQTYRVLAVFRDDEVPTS